MPLATAALAPRAARQASSRQLLDEVASSHQSPSLQDGAVSRAFERRIAQLGYGRDFCAAEFPSDLCRLRVQSRQIDPPPTLTRYPLWSESDGSAKRGTR